MILELFKAYLSQACWVSCHLQSGSPSSNIDNTGP